VAEGRALAEERGIRLLVEVADALAAHPAGRAAPAATAQGAPLTDREEQVLALIEQGLSNKQIGERLYISAKTASVHVSSILRKVGASSRTEAVYRASRPTL
jgi:DNA-binding NarL/FixJ family response regulator